MLFDLYFFHLHHSHASNIELDRKLLQRLSLATNQVHAADTVHSLMVQRLSRSSAMGALIKWLTYDVISTAILWCGIKRPPALPVESESRLNMRAWLSQRINSPNARRLSSHVLLGALRGQNVKHWDILTVSKCSLQVLHLKQTSKSAGRIRRPFNMLSGI